MGILYNRYLAGNFFMEPIRSQVRNKLTLFLLEKASGFTLIELLVVIIIVGVLSAVAIPTFLNQIRRARIAEAQSILIDLDRNAENFRLDYGTYPKAGTYPVNPGERVTIPNAIKTFECGAPNVAGRLLECLEGTGTNFLKLYITDPFAEKAPNYSTLGSSQSGILNTMVIAEISPNFRDGLLIEAKANNDIAPAYKNINAEPLACRRGLGSANLITSALGGPNLETGCNLKSNPTPTLAVVSDRP